jgi:site-specific DNA recombinase
MMTKPTKRVRCAVYTRVSTEYGLDQEFNSLDAQHEAAEAYIRSQAHDGWTLIRTRYDDGGYSGGSTERPALQRLLADIRDHRIDIVVVYKVDRLTRSLADFAKLVELFDQHSVSFVSVTQQFNTTSSMGRLTLNVLLSFAQFEREVTGERIRDKIGASNCRVRVIVATVRATHCHRRKMPAPPPDLTIPRSMIQLTQTSVAVCSALSGPCFGNGGQHEH